MREGRRPASKKDLREDGGTREEAPGGRGKTILGGVGQAYSGHEGGAQGSGGHVVLGCVGVLGGVRAYGFRSKPARGRW